MTRQYQVRTGKQWENIEPKDIKEFDVIRIVDDLGNTITDGRGRKVYIAESVHKKSDGSWSVNVY